MGHHGLYLGLCRCSGRTAALCLSFPFAKSRALRSALGPQCPNTFTERCEQRAINIHLWESRPKKTHFPGC